MWLQRALGLGTIVLILLTTQCLLTDALLLAREVCYPPFGCFQSHGLFFSLLYRQIDLLPSSPEDIDTKFLVYTRQNPTRAQTFTMGNTTIGKTSLDPTKPIKFLVHGFQDQGDSTWLKDIRTEILTNNDVNVVVVDWSGGSKVNYIQAAGNTRLVGAQIGALIVCIKDKYGLNIDDVHIIGHSLGAHIAGYAGNWVQGKLGRISGLDPAYPYFQHMPEVVRLDSTDAKFVDVIHTDAKGFGMYLPAGHLDFYPDGGNSVGSCNIANLVQNMINVGPIDGLFDATACNHRRVQELYKQSINGKCPFTGHICNSFKDYADAQCVSCGADNENCGRMGYHADEYPKALLPPQPLERLFYLSTNKDEYQLCVYHSAITVTTANNQPEYKYGKFFIALFGKTIEYGDMDLTRTGPIRIPVGKTLTFMVETLKPLEVLVSLDLWWEKAKLGPLDPGYFDELFHNRPAELRVNRVKVESMDVTPESSRLKTGQTLCAKKLGQVIEPTVKTTFTAGFCK